MFVEDLDFQMDLGRVPDQSEINWKTQYNSRHDVMLIQIKLILAFIPRYMGLFTHVSYLILFGFPRYLPYLLIARTLSIHAVSFLFKIQKSCSWLAILQNTFSCFMFVLMFSNVKLLLVHRIFAFGDLNLPLCLSELKFSRKHQENYRNLFRNSLSSEL